GGGARCRSAFGPLVVGESRVSRVRLAAASSGDSAEGRAATRGRPVKRRQRVAGRRTPMDYFPIFLRLANEPVLVVGGGEVAARKIDLLLRTQAKVTVVSPELIESLARKAADGVISYVPGEFQPELLDGMRLAIAATDKQSVNAWVAHQAERRNIPVNVVDDRD